MRSLPLLRRISSSRRFWAQFLFGEEAHPKDKDPKSSLLLSPRAPEKAPSPDWMKRTEDPLDRVMDALEERERARPTRLFQERPYRPQYNNHNNKKGSRGQYARIQDCSPSPRPAKKR
jgi:hypothetical protein